MPRAQRNLTREDIMPLDQYELIRADKRQDSILRKRYSRLAVGPHATALFETWESMWLQVHEMLRAERGGDAQIDDELAAYDPMVPKGNELTVTLLFEVEDPVRRDAFLRTIGGVDRHVSLRIGDHMVQAVPENDVERTRASDGKASAVHFLHFPLGAEAAAAWREGTAPAMLVIDHPNYGHAAMINAETRDFLTRECL